VGDHVGIPSVVLFCLIYEYSDRCIRAFEYSSFLTLREALLPDLEGVLHKFTNHLASTFVISTLAIRIVRFVDNGKKESIEIQSVGSI
jgi:hypothetical protein